MAQDFFGGTLGGVPLKPKSQFGVDWLDNILGTLQMLPSAESMQFAFAKKQNELMDSQIKHQKKVLDFQDAILKLSPPKPQPTTPRPGQMGLAAGIGLLAELLRPGAGTQGLSNFFGGFEQARNRQSEMEQMEFQNQIRQMQGMAQLEQQRGQIAGMEAERAGAESKRIGDVIAEGEKKKDAQRKAIFEFSTRDFGDGEEVKRFAAGLQEMGITIPDKLVQSVSKYWDEQFTKKTRAELIKWAEQEDANLSRDWNELSKELTAFEGQQLPDHIITRWKSLRERFEKSSDRLAKAGVSYNFTSVPPSVPAGSVAPQTAAGADRERARRDRIAKESEDTKRYYQDHGVSHEAPDRDQQVVQNVLLKIANESPTNKVYAETSKALEVGLRTARATEVGLRGKVKERLAQFSHYEKMVKDGKTLTDIQKTAMEDAYKAYLTAASDLSAAESQRLAWQSELNAHKKGGIQAPLRSGPTGNIAGDIGPRPAGMSDAQLLAQAQKAVDGGKDYQYVLAMLQQWGVKGTLRPKK